MKRYTSAAVIALACATGLGITLVRAQGNTAPSPTDQLDAFVGDGICSGNVMPMGKNPGHASTGKFHGERTLDGNWVVIHYEDAPSSANPKPYRVVQYFRHDAASKRFIAVTVDNSSDAYSTGTSSGWKGDTITFDERTPSGSKSVAFRDVFVRNGTAAQHHIGLMRDEHGKWVKTDEETCKRA
jgi:hypothetical protein